MRASVSVLIPAYNCQATIEATLESVLQQTLEPREILVMDDGSTDGTASLLHSYGPRITVFRQANKGLSGARNALVERASSDLIAFLDADDLWHPKYIETQFGLFNKYPKAAAFFTGHTTFREDQCGDWHADDNNVRDSVEVIDPLNFLSRYATAPGPFLMGSFCCVPRRVLDSIGGEPFKLRIAEDLYFCNLLTLEGPVVYCSVPLGAYRIRDGSLSSNRLVLNEGEVRAFELLADRYKTIDDGNLSRAFGKAFAMKRRLFAKTLLGACKTREARAQLKSALAARPDMVAIAKSLTLLFLSYMPARFQPQWPPIYREWKDVTTTKS